MIDRRRCGLRRPTGREAEHIDGVDAGIDATDDHGLHRRHDLQVCGEAPAGERFVTLGQSLNYTHFGCLFLFWLGYVGAVMERFSRLRLLRRFPEKPNE